MTYTSLLPSREKTFFAVAMSYLLVRNKLKAMRNGGGGGGGGQGNFGHQEPASAAVSLCLQPSPPTPSSSSTFFPFSSSSSSSLATPYDIKPGSRGWLAKTLFWIFLLAALCLFALCPSGQQSNLLVQSSSASALHIPISGEDIPHSDKEEEGGGGEEDKIVWGSNSS